MYIKLGLGVIASLGVWVGVGIPAIAAPILSSSAIIAQAQGKLTEEGILQTLQAMQAARDQENLNELMKYVAPFASAEITMDGGELTTTLKVEGKDNHRLLLEDVFKRVQNRETLTQKIDIRLTSDEKLGIAEVFTVRSITEADGKKYLYSSQDVLHFALLDNRPTLVYTKSTGWVEALP